MVANFPDSILVVVGDHRSRPPEISDAARAGVLQVEEPLQLGLVAASSESCGERPLQLAGKTISVGLLFVFDQLQINVNFETVLCGSAAWLARLPSSETVAPGGIVTVQGTSSLRERGPVRKFISSFNVPEMKVL